MEEVGKVIREATDSFMEGRRQGQRKTSGLFTAHFKATKKEVREKLDPVKNVSTYRVKRDASIRDFIEAAHGHYPKGNAYYFLQKPETIQSYKKVCVRDKSTGKVYTGDNARHMLGLPDHDVRVKPGDFGFFDIFVMSTSVNRKLIANTDVLVLG